ncbi:MAG: hypothetical protein ACKKMV_01230 [Candidatus Nealsonbacteria bacterium]|nr:MAG: hypothetical protein IB617_00660 [Candidatus Nealsonbacteria bacterium]
MKKILLTTFLVFLLSLSTPVSILAICEGPIVPCGRYGKPACNLCHIFELLNNILKFFLTCLLPITVVLMITIAGFMFIVAHFGGTEMLAGGQKGGPALLSQGKKAITAVVIGFIIIFASWVFLNTFLGAIGIAEWTGLKESWWEIKCQ